MNKSELLAVAKPILFNTPMVQAILDGRKTATRRIVKETALSKLREFDSFKAIQRHRLTPKNKADFLKGNAPYKIGDILYVRETWHKYTKRIGKGESCRLEQFYGYKASIANSEDSREKWRPSIHMPKEAARIFLRVTDVRVKRLQDMTLDDFLNEGIVLLPEAFNDPDNAYYQAKNRFSALWNSTVKKADLDRYGWNANPFVWVIEFERLEIEK